jgi:lysophospholipase L1-like esterase
MASFLLTTLLLGPFLYSSYRKYHRERASLPPAPFGIEDPPVPEFLTKADLLSCATTNLLAQNTTYSRMYLDVKLDRTPICGTKKKCRCRNPTIPIMRNVGAKTGSWSNESWRAAFERNKELVAAAISKAVMLDAVFLGDSITEMWRGMAMNNQIKEVKEVPALWDELFKENDHNHALPLGVASDRSNNLLYRLQNGELPERLNPTAWWILIGTNDYMDNCSREAILVGIMAVLDEVLRHNSPATTRVVLNSLLPRGKDKDLLTSALWQEFIWVNDQLECLARALPEQLYFFNATSLFVGTNENKVQVNHTLMYDYLHPSFEGYKVWGHAIVETLKELGIWKAATR